MSSPAGQLRLEVIGGNGAGTTIAVEDVLVIGRHAEGAGRLSEDEEISRRHARISREATGDYAIEDLGSSNGTFVNGLRIQSPRLLALGDSIETGATTLVVREIVQPRASATVVSAVPDIPARGPAPAVFARGPAAPVPPPAAAPDLPPAAAPVPPLKFELEVDYDAGRARISLGGGGDTIDLVFEDGAWRARPAEPTSAEG
jgi:hypothetical protein